MATTNHPDWHCLVSAILKPKPEYIPVSTQSCYKTSVSAHVSETEASTIPNPIVTRFYWFPESQGPFSIQRRRTGLRLGFGSGFSWLIWSSRRKYGLFIIQKQVSSLIFTTKYLHMYCVLYSCMDVVLVFMLRKFCTSLFVWLLRKERERETWIGIYLKEFGYQEKCRKDKNFVWRLIYIHSSTHTHTHTHLFGRGKRTGSGKKGRKQIIFSLKFSFTLLPSY